MHLNLPFGPVMSFDVQTGYAWDRAGERDRGLETPGLVVTRCMARGTRVWVSRMTNGAVSRRLSPGDAHALLREIRTAQCSARASSRSTAPRLTLRSLGASRETWIWRRSPRGSRTT